MTDGLKDEKVRWGQNIIKFNSAKEMIPGDCIIAAAMLSYSGAFISEFR